MKASELIRRLEAAIVHNGDLEIELSVDYFGGDYGGHNCVTKSPLDDIHITKDIIFLEGFFGH